MDFKECKIIRKKIKNAKITISHNGDVTISIPRFCLPSYAERLFENKKEWIESKLSDINKAKDIFEKNRWKILYLWELYEFEYNKDTLTDIIDSEKNIIISKYDLSDITKLQKWHINTAKKYLTTLTQDLAKKWWFKISKISIRNQKSRWWSCSHRNNISLNFRLIKCPINIIEYVIYHELVHTIEKNHSYRFWHKLWEYHKNYKEDRKWLKNNWNGMFIN